MNKKLALGLAAIFYISTNAAVQEEISCTTISKCEKCRQREREDEEEVTTVLTNFAGMVVSFINMTQDPHNSRNIGYNLGNMIHGIGNIVSAAIRGGIEIEEYVTSEDFREKIHGLLLNQDEPED